MQQAAPGEHKLRPLAAAAEHRPQLGAAPGEPRLPPLAALAEHKPRLVARQRPAVAGHKPRLVAQQALRQAALRLAAV